VREQLDQRSVESFLRYETCGAGRSADAVADALFRLRIVRMALVDRCGAAIPVSFGLSVQRQLSALPDEEIEG